MQVHSVRQGPPLPARPLLRRGSRAGADSGTSQSQIPLSSACASFAGAAFFAGAFFSAFGADFLPPEAEMLEI